MEIPEGLGPPDPPGPPEVVFKCPSCRSDLFTMDNQPEIGTPVTCTCGWSKVLGE